MSKYNKSSKHSKLDKASILAKISYFIEHGRKEITTKEELEKFPIGSLISYMNHNNDFKCGGFITKFSKDYFIYIISDFSQKYRVRYINVQKMWAGDLYSVSKDLISLTISSQKKTNFPVEVNGVVIYYGKNNFDAKRYINTDKHKILVQWCEYFKK